MSIENPFDVGNITKEDAALLENCLLYRRRKAIKKGDKDIQEAVEDLILKLARATGEEE